MAVRIGLLTFFESDNYGTVLQAYALQHYLESKGHEVELIQIKRKVNAASQHYSNITAYYSLLERVRIKVSSSIQKYNEEKKIVAFKQFRDKHLHIAEKCYNTDEELLCDLPRYDLYLSGGDQIWNPYHKVFSYHYMFDFLPKEVSRASYSSSFGVAAIMEQEILNKMSTLLADYKAISVREESGVKILSQMGINGEAVLDPVFLIEDRWKKLTSAYIQPKERYCLVYSLVDYPKKEDEIIRDFAEKNHLKIVVLPSNRHNYSTGYRKEFAAGPERFLTLIANAEHIFTNSFHGMAFAIIFKKQFSLLSSVSAESTSKRDRLSNLLNILLLPQRPVVVQPEHIDYMLCSSRLDEYKDRSYKYLENVLRY